MSKKKFIVISAGWNGLPIAYHLQNEGYEVVVGEVQDLADCKCDDKKESPEDKEQRLTQYDGMLKKVPVDKLIEALSKVQNKDDYFIFCDFNKMWKYSELLLNAGFKNGLFPLKDDFDFEKSRERAMEFVDKNYDGIKLIPFEEFKKTEEAIKFLEENEGVYVIQSDGDFVSTYVPQTDNEKVAKEQSINQLNKFKSDYDKGGVILKTKLVNPIEVTPQIVFYNGKPVFTDLDIETKNIGEGINNGCQVGCGTNLIISTELKDKINKIAFPKAVYEMAAKRTGMFVWDISFYIMPDGIYFGEFCPNRLGYDASMTEMEMSGGAGTYFNSIVEGNNPLKTKFGTAIRLFNLAQKDGVSVNMEGIEDHTWLYEVRKDGSDIVSTLQAYEIGVITGASDNLREAIDTVYEYREDFGFKDCYNKTKKDFLGDYDTSIIYRFKDVNHKFIETPDLEDEENPFGDALSSINKILSSQSDKIHKKAELGNDGKISKVSQDYEAKLEKEKEKIKKEYADEISNLKKVIARVINED